MNIPIPDNESIWAIIGMLVGIVFGFYMGYNWKNKIMRKKWD
jgi:membrane protein DedA with SNARE-associated domain